MFSEGKMDLLARCELRENVFMKVTMSQAGDAYTMMLDGVFSERTNLESAIKKMPKSLDVYCRGVTSINSVSVETWTRFFHKLRCEPVVLRFHEVSPALVDQMNYVIGFIEPNELISFCTPFECRSCSIDTLQIETVAEIKAKNGPRLEMKCPSCGHQLIFEDKEYFEFLKAQPA